MDDGAVEVEGALDDLNAPVAAAPDHRNARDRIGRLQERRICVELPIELHRTTLPPVILAASRPEEITTHDALLLPQWGSGRCQRLWDSTLDATQTSDCRISDRTIEFVEAHNEYVPVRVQYM